jgi:hypothetical protein
MVEFLPSSSGQQTAVVIEQYNSLCQGEFAPTNHATCSAVLRISDEAAALFSTLNIAFTLVTPEKTSLTHTQPEKRAPSVLTNHCRTATLTHCAAEFYKPLFELNHHCHLCIVSPAVAIVPCGNSYNWQMSNYQFSTMNVECLTHFAWRFPCGGCNNQDTCDHHKHFYLMIIDILEAAYSSMYRPQGTALVLGAILHVMVSLSCYDSSFTDKGEICAPLV